MSDAAPTIALAIGEAGLRIRQRRPALARLFAGRPVDHALAALPRLLPICGQAQAVAAARALEAARGRVEAPAAAARREAGLWEEQARAVAWRLTVDWPDLLGEPRQLDVLRALRACEDLQDLAGGLRRLVDSLGEAESLDQALDWARAGRCTAARVVALALDRARHHARRAPVLLLKGEALAVQAIGAFAINRFDAQDPHAEGPVEVGPLAMARHPLVTSVRHALGAVPAARLLAMALDVLVIAEGLEQAAAGGEAPPAAWALDPDCGLGRAQTARGPVFHRVTLDPADRERVADWRVLAPTDWHFAPTGPLVSAGAAVDWGQAALECLVASYDPCAPWTLARDGRG